MAESLVFSREIIIGDEHGQHVRVTPSGIALVGAGGVIRATVWMEDHTISLTLRDGGGQERVRFLVSSGSPGS